VNLRAVGNYVFIALFSAPTFFFLYLFFKFVFDFWLSDIAAVAVAAAAVYLMTLALLRSKMSIGHKTLTATVIVLTVGGLVTKLLAIQVIINKMQLIVNGL
jgi:hypothetical protein